MFYDYECDSKDHPDIIFKKEIQHGMKEKPVILCGICHKTMRKVITGGTGFRMNEKRMP